MERYFNTEGICWPDLHYMVPLDERLEKIKGLFVDRGKYFIINRGRQYGKTTTLQALFSGPLICNSSPSSTPIILRFGFFYCVPQFLNVL